MQKINSINCRKANLKDIDIYFQWANDGHVRKNAISSEPIQFSDHEVWFIEKLKNSNVFLFIIEESEIPIGQVRFDIIDQMAVIDFSVGPDFRGKGWGKIILKTAMNQLLEVAAQQIKAFQGVVKVVNFPSGKVFENLGFQVTRTKRIKKESYRIYEFNTVT